MAGYKFKPLPQFTEAEIKRFWSKIENRGPRRCWRWRGPFHERGYGEFYIYRNYERFRYRVSRVMWMLSTGSDPGDLIIRHSCDNPTCPSPHHALSGTQADNMADRKARGRGWHAPLSPHFIRESSGVRVKLTKRDIPKIRKLRADGLTLLKIATLFHVSISAIHKVVRGRMWAHVQ